MGDSNNPEQLKIRGRKNSTDGKKPSNRSFHSTGFKKAAERAAQVVLMGSALVGGGKALAQNINSQNSESSVKLSQEVDRDKDSKIVISFEKDGTMKVVGSNSKKAQSFPKEAPKVSSSIKEQSNSKPEIKNDSFREVFPYAAGSEYAQIYKKTANFESAIKNDVDFEKMQAFVDGWGDHLNKVAAEYRLDPNILLGLILIESSGDPIAESPAGAKGIAQLMEDTARRYGLRVDSQVDERENPYLSIIAMSKYLGDLRDAFGGDMGLAIWAYHAGEGNVMHALREYFIDTAGVDVGDYEVALGMPNSIMRNDIENNTRNLMKENKVNFHKLSKNKAVDEFIGKLKDDSGNYAYKMIVAIKLLAQNLNYNNFYTKAS